MVMPLVEGGEKDKSAKELVEALQEAVDKGEIKVETDPERLRPIDADLQIPCTDKFKKHTGWEPEISFKTTMRDLLEYWRKYYD